MINLFPLLETLTHLLQILNKWFIFFLIILHVSGKVLYFGLLSIKCEFEFIELLTLIVGDIAVDLSFQLLQCFFYILRSNFLQKCSLTLTDLPQRLFLNLFSQVLKLTHSFITTHLKLFQTHQHFFALLLGCLTTRQATLSQPLLYVLLTLERVQHTRQALYPLTHSLHALK